MIQQETYTIIANQQFIKDKPQFRQGTVTHRFDKRPTRERILELFLRQYGISPDSVAAIESLSFEVYGSKGEITEELQDAVIPDTFTNLPEIPLEPDTELIDPSISLT